MILIIIVVRAAPSGHQVFCVDVLPVAYRQVQLRLLICLCHSFLNPKVAYIYIYIYPCGFTQTRCHITLNFTLTNVCPLQSRGCSAMAATSSRVRGTWTWAAPTQRSLPVPTHTKASNTASASRQRAVSKSPRATSND